MHPAIDIALVLIVQLAIPRWLCTDDPTPAMIHIGISLTVVATCMWRERICQYPTDSMRGTRLLLACPLVVFAQLMIYELLRLVGAVAWAAAVRAALPWVVLLASGVPLAAVALFDFDGYSRRRLDKKRQ